MFIKSMICSGLGILFPQTVPTIEGSGKDRLWWNQRRKGEEL
jgi:hypothetical protein